MKFFAVFGDPIKHSLSPRIHNLALQELKLQGRYIRYLLKDKNDLKNKFIQLKLCGANVTVPHKEAAALQADICSDFVKKIGAANTLVAKNNQIYAYNTDAPGFMGAINEFIKNYDIKNALILGAGGTALALAHAMFDSNIEVNILNRSKERLNKFKDYFQTDTWDTFCIRKFDIIINTTSAGLNDDNLPAPNELLEPILTNSRCAFDVIYGKKTPFLSLCNKFDKPAKDGADMLLYQAVLAFELFFENKLNKEDITRAMKKAFLLK